MQQISKPLWGFFRAACCCPCRAARAARGAARFGQQGQPEGLPEQPLLIIKKKNFWLPESGDGAPATAMTTRVSKSVLDYQSVMGLELLGHWMANIFVNFKWAKMFLVKNKFLGP